MPLIFGEDYNMSEKIFDLVGTQIEIGSYVVTPDKNYGTLSIYQVTRIVYSTPMYLNVIVHLHYSPRSKVGISSSRSPDEVIVLSDKQITFHILRTGGDLTSPPVSNINGCETDLIGTPIKTGSYVATAERAARSCKWIIYKVNLDPICGVTNTNTVMALSDEQMAFHILRTGKDWL